ncbi:non-ribosomal peptide synthase domain TIGR01720/amino acid adenylation domain-containing protein [Pseudomonas saponiphila]|uniref:Non-ribosomal peptide synthase domain TIGR01720/amino acid adenylation domain-containing protein n=1 Tax=Pseudomonas saponiphila TaxID=556534 RepID=A0A1H4LGP7_9PSED|nr:non-ribosomal peptide synthetase [Pseudomonas saponiphila]SEB69854.1 non-ribosomal peptide synthase domain TIGR01720/amino acid adenylation domain-containing protein [Pseudomonas saponiphila]
MNAEKSLKLARRFIELPLEKRRLFLDSLRAENIDFSLFPIPAEVAVEDRQELSYAQRRMWFLWQLDPQSGAYNLPGAVRLNGALDRQALEQAFAALVARHETLRTVFKRHADDRLEQAPATGSLSVEFLDLSTIDAPGREQAVAAEAQRQSLLPFDLGNGPLLRVKLLQLAEQEHVLLLTLHHIVSDGWSMNVLIDEFIRCYDAFERGEAPQLPPLPIQYSDYALWQRRWLEAGEQARQLEYWQAQLGDEHPVLELPTDHPRPAVPSYRGTRYDFAVAPELAEQLRTLARQHNVTLFMLLLGAFNVLLQRYTGQDDIRVGVPIANRNRAEVEGLIGFFVNTQVLRTRLTGQTRVGELLQAVKDAALGAQAHQDLPFEQLVEALKLERNLSHTPLFQVMYNHQPQVADISTVQTASGLELSLVQWQSRTTQFDLTLDTYEKSGTLHAALTYADDLFEAATIARMARHWLSLLQAMLGDAEQRIGELPMLDAREQQTLVHDWNATQVAYPSGLCMHQLIEAQVRRTPEACALVFGEQRLSYAELDARANRLARLLREQGVGPDVLVGICIERSVEMVLGLLAIHKAGGAYVPLDPEYPPERLSYMIEDSGIRLLLTQSALLPSLPVPGAAAPLLRIMALDQQRDWLDAYSDSPLQLPLDPLNLAYVIYTSGSTGKPKGAGNSHAALVNRLHWMQQAYGLDARDAVLQKTPFSFDVSVWEFFWPLMTGARLVMADPGAHREPARLIRIITEQQISTLHFVPSMLQAFIHDSGASACVSLTRIVCSGEALPLEAQQQVFARLPGAALYNLYGPTEAAIDVTHWTCVDEGASSVPIGRPIANLRTHVLDAQLLPVPAGVAGELYLGGAGLARSYHRRPALTAERFVPCPFQAGARLYRTGDRVRQRADGVIEYLGRLDHQVKLRGLRIELGEIEARLMEHPGVREAVVLVQNAKHLVAYLVLQETALAGDWRDELRAWLAGSLPEYMVPHHWLALERLPVTANGKLDRRALPLPDAAPQLAYVAPENTMQKALAGIWCDVLGLERVGLDDNFFELGGDSIISIQVVSRARQAGIRLAPRDLFQYQSVRHLAQVAVLDDQPQIDQGPVTGEVPLTPVQHWFLGQEVPRRGHWNQSLLLDPRQHLQPQLLQASLVQLINHHDALRLRFVDAGRGWQQAYAEPASHVDLWQCRAEHDQDLAALCDEAQRSLDLQAGPLVRAVLVERGAGRQQLLLVIHHLVVDGVSWRVLLEDLQLAYRQLAAAQPLQLPPKTSAYQAWARRLQEHAPRCEDELPYWLAQQAGAVDLPCDNPAGGLQNRHGRKIESRLPTGLTRQLLQQASSAYRTQVNDLLLTALARVLCRWSGQASALIQLEGHGREDLFDDLDLTRTLGWFTSLYPVRLQPAEQAGAAIKGIKEQLRAIPSKGLGYGLLRYLGSPAQRQALASAPQPRVTFNYLGQFDRQFDEQALWAPASQSSGQAQDPQAPLANWLTLEGQVYGGELALQWGYSQEMFSEASVQRLADDYLAELCLLIEHCCSLQQPQATPSDFPLARISQQQLDALPVPAAVIEDLYPLTPMQQGMLFHTLYEPQEQAYINQLRLDIHGLDPQRFAEAWQSALERHPILRSSVHWEGLDSAHQLVRSQVKLPLQVLPSAPADLDQLAEQQRRQGFELDRAPLLRLLLVPIADNHWHLIYTCHHLLLDGWSNASLLAQVIQLYAGAPLPAPLGRYRDYLGWLQEQPAQAAQQFWSQRLQAMEAPTLLADGVRRPASGSGHGQHLDSFDTTLTQRLGRFARQQKVTLNTLLQAAWALLLQRYSAQQCVIFGATVAGRSAPLPGIEQQLGLFINTLPIICQPRSQLRVGQWLEQMQELNLSLREHEHVPLYEVQGWAGHQGTPLFDSLLVFENFPVAQALKEGAPAGLRFGGLANHEQTSYPLTLGIELGEQLSLDFSYARSRFSAEQVQGFSAQLRHLLEQFMADPDTALGALQLLTAPARQGLLQRGQMAERVQPQARLVHQRIAAQAAATPEALALLVDTERLDYGQLNAQANRLAHCLQAQGIGPGDRVGLALKRGPQLIVSLLAVLKSGAAYVPLDPQYPQERLAFMIADSRLSLLLSDTGSWTENLLPDNVPHWDLPSLAPRLSQYSSTDPQNRARAQDLAYVIYTSGSTGVPKGVAIDHRALSAFCEAAADYSALTASDRVLQFATFSFDGFVEQCYPALCLGATLVMRGDEPWAVEQLAAVIVSQGVTLADLPAAYWHLLAKQCMADGIRSLGRLRQVHVGGEAMSVEGLRLWHGAGLGAVRLVNTYGPTEATVVSSVHDCREQDASEVYGIPIGQPIIGRDLRIIDGDLNLLPEGAAGELCIGSASSLAQGYFDRPGLTAERFIPDPFASRPGARLYRSGDLARYNPQGALEYLGRIDHQVKIRGFRIELGEIEARLLARPDVREAVVLAVPAGNGMQLVAYVVPGEVGEGLGDAQAQAERGVLIKAGLKEQLPDYMLPNHVLLLPRLPLNPNGKLDRKALPKPDLSASQAAHVAPHTALQRQVAAIWQSVLEVDRVGLQDNFFALGGHSLLATQVISRVRHEQGLQAALRTLFDAPDLQAFVAALDAADAPASVPALQRVDDSRPQPLSFAQQRLWFLWQLEPQSSMYNIARALELHGELDIDAVRQAFESLMQRHSVLRTTYSEVEGESWQHVHRQLPLSFAFVDLCALPLAEREAMARQQVQQQAGEPFDLISGPPMRVRLLRLAPQRHLLLMTLHHIVADHWSFGILPAEFVVLYHAHRTATASPLPEPALQYVDFAVWQRQWLEGGELQRQLDYWRAVLGDDHHLTRLPASATVPPGQEPSPLCDLHEFHFPAAQSEALRAFASAQGVTLYMLLLAGFALVVGQRSDSPRVRLGTDIANRNHAGVEDLVGFFVNQLVLQISVEEQQCVGDLLQVTRSAVIGASDHQDLPFERLVEALRVARRAGRSPLFSIKFIYQESLDQPLSIDGLDVQPVAAGRAAAELDLVAEFVNAPQGIYLGLKCDAGLYTAADMACLFEQLQAVFELMLADTRAPLAGLLSKARDIQYLCERDQLQQRQALLKQQHPIQRRRPGRVPVE